MDIPEPKNKQKTEPNDLKTEYDKYLYHEAIKSTQRDVETQKKQIGKIEVQMRRLEGELRIIDSNLKVINDELGIPDISPYSVLESCQQELRNLPPEEHKEVLLKGLAAGRELVEYLESNGKIDSNRAAGLLELNKFYVDQLEKDKFHVNQSGKGINMDEKSIPLNFVKNYLNGLLSL